MVIARRILHHKFKDNLAGLEIVQIHDCTQSFIKQAPPN